MGVKIEEDIQEHYIKSRINKGRATKEMLSGLLWKSKKITRKNKSQIYSSIVKGTVAYGAETWEHNKNLYSELISMEVDF